MLYIPETIEEARKIIPNIDEKRYRKWRQDGAVELTLEEVYEPTNTQKATVIIDEDEIKIELEETHSGKQYLETLYRRQQPDKDNYYHLQPGKYYILVTEPVNIPTNLLPTDVNFRSTFHRLGLIGRISNIDPGYSGKLHVLLYLTQYTPKTKIKRVTRIIQVRFLKIDNAPQGYQGYWKNV